MVEISRLLLDTEASRCLKSSLQSVSEFAKLVKSLSVRAILTGSLTDTNVLRQFIETGQIARFGVIGSLAVLKFYESLVAAEPTTCEVAQLIRADLIAIESNIEAILYESSYALQEKVALTEAVLTRVRNSAGDILAKLGNISRQADGLVERQEQLRALQRA